MANRNQHQNQNTGRWDTVSNDQRRTWKEKRHITRPLPLTILIRVLQVIGTMALIGAVTGTFLVCFAAIYVQTSIVPRAKVDFSAYTLNENSTMYYTDQSTGQDVEWLTLVGSENREYVEYEKIPENLINAVVAIEDKRFWDHQGVDWYRTAGAFVNMFLSMRSTFGASTLTQQTIKNITQYDDVTVTRKILEIFTALQVERDYDKKDILELYLNKIFLGNGCYGVQAASRYYFGKDVWDLDLAECASLAGITNNPALYSPYGAVSVTRYTCQNCGQISNYPEEPCNGCGEIDYGPGEVWTNREYNLARARNILREMLNLQTDEEPTLFDKLRTLIFGEDIEHSYITQAEYDQAVAETQTMTFARGSQTTDPDSNDDGDPDRDTENTSNLYNWYQEAVINQAIDQLVEATGLDRDVCRHMVFSGGLNIYTAYDPVAQAAVDQIYDNPSILNSYSSSGQKLQSNITLVDNSTGFVVAMGTTFPKTGNRVWCYPVATVKQPGSSIKPLSVYGPALEMGLITPASVSDDNPRLLNGRVWPTNAPAEYRGLTTILSGVTRSVNTVAVNTLELVTPQMSYEFMTQRFGITSLVENSVNSLGEVQSDLNPSPLAMGGLTRGISTFEMAAAYATYPRNGSFTAANTILRIEDINHNVLVDNTTQQSKVVLKESTVYYMNSMLTNVVTSGTGTSARISGQTVAGKTGTTERGCDLWFCGYTSYYTAAVWTGYEYSEVIPSSVVYSWPSAVLFQRVMSILHQGKENRPFPTPNNLETYSICIDCGNLAGPNCALDPRGDRVQSFRLVSGDGPTESCSCHVTVEVCVGSVSKDGDEDGDEVATVYHLATEYCPADTVRKITLVDHERELASASVKVWDQAYLLSAYTSKISTCPIHDANWVEPTEEPSDQPTEEPSGPVVDVTPPPTQAPATPPPTQAPATPPPTQAPATPPPTQEPATPPPEQPSESVVDTPSAEAYIPA